MKSYDYQKARVPRYRWTHMAQLIEALSYKPEGRGFDSLPVALWPWDRLKL